jgi:hypothetical protein
VSDTPRTDVVVEVCCDGSNEFHGEWVNADFTRQLERELNEARREILRLNRRITDLQDRWDGDDDCDDDDEIEPSRLAKARQAIEFLLGLDGALMLSGPEIDWCERKLSIPGKLDNDDVYGINKILESREREANLNGIPWKWEGGEV